jgi:4-phytase/acid phosphatase
MLGMMQWVIVLGVLLPGLATAQPVLERVVIVARHGVRVPNSPDELAPYASAAWPAWQVAPGELTPHGAKGATLAGGWLRRHYAAAGLVSASGCPGVGEVQVWADGKDHRTVETGAALLAGFAPGCNVTAGHGPVGKLDPVFTAIGAGVCPLSHAETDSVVAELNARVTKLPPAYAEGLAALRTVLAPPACPASGCWWDGANIVGASSEGVKLRGPLADGASLAEALSLEYLEGFQGQSLGWGRLDEHALTSIMALHDLSSLLRRRDPIIAGHNAAAMASRILSAVSGKSPVKFSVFVGHDTTLDNLAGLLDVDWAHPGQPDATPPDGMLVFETYRGAGGAETVRISFVYQTADQLRTLRPLVGGETPGISPIVPRGCDTTGCSVAAFETALTTHIPKICLAAR